MDGEQYLQTSSTPAIAVGMNVAAGGVVQDDGLNIKVEPADTDLDTGPAVPQHVDTHCRRSKTKANFTEGEPGLAELVKSEPALLVKEEVVGDGWQDIADLQCGPSTSAIVGSTNVFDSAADPGDTLNIKEELGAIDIGPTVLQPMDTQGTTKQKDMNLSPILCGGVKEEIIEDEWRADTDDQRSNEVQQARSCDKCAKTFASKASLVAHYRNLHSKLSHKCTKCKKKFTSKAYLSKHTRYVHSEQQYECAVCKKICRSKPSLKNHVYKVHRPRPAADTDNQRSNKASQSEQRARSQLYSCDKCGKTYTSKKSLMQHNKNRHSTESHKCTKCKKKFTSKQYLYDHTKRAHSEQQYECAVCKKIYRSMSALNKHVYNVHQSRPAESRLRHTCTNCGQNFSSKWNCQHHEKKGKCARPTAGNTSAAASTSRQHRNVVIVKEEPDDGEVELGPVVFQHMDCNYRPYKQEPGLD